MPDLLSRALPRAGAPGPAARASKRLWSHSIALALLLPASAQAQNAFIDAARSMPVERAATTSATALVRAFVEACLAGDGEPQPVVDWAINNGFDPIDAHAGAGAMLLDGQPGTVLRAAGDGPALLLAVNQRRECTVWAERAPGPPARSELARALAELAQRGVLRSSQPQPDRQVERGGAWRQQSQWRLQRNGAPTEYNVGSVTTLSPHPATQVLRLSPVAASAAAPMPAPAVGASLSAAPPRPGASAVPP